MTALQFLKEAEGGLLAKVKELTARAGSAMAQRPSDMGNMRQAQQFGLSAPKPVTAPTKPAAPAPKPSTFVQRPLR